MSSFWLRHEALRLASPAPGTSVPRIDGAIPHLREVARRELAGLVRLGLLHLIGRGRGARCVPLSLWLTFLDEAAEWIAALV